MHWLSLHCNEKIYYELRKFYDFLVFSKTIVKSTFTVSLCIMRTCDILADNKIQSKSSPSFICFYGLLLIQICSFCSGLIVVGKNKIDIFLSKEQLRPNHPWLHLHLYLLLFKSLLISPARTKEIHISSFFHPTLQAQPSWGKEECRLHLQLFQLPLPCKSR